MSPGLIYFYFAGKDEIYGRICEEAFDLTIDLLDKASAKDMGFKKVGLTQELKGLLEDRSQKTISFLKAVVGDAMEKGEIPGATDSWTLTFGLWGVIEGALYIHRRGSLDPVGVSLEEGEWVKVAILSDVHANLLKRLPLQSPSCQGNPRYSTPSASSIGSRP